MKNKGFSLMELLAVIAIIAILSVIAVPYISKVVEGSRESSFLSSAKSVLRAVKLDYEANRFQPKTYYFPESQNLISDEDTFTGYVDVTFDEKVKMAIDNGKYCAEKGYNSDIVVKKSGECNLTYPQSR